MLTNNDALEYETIYNIKCYITKCWTNGTVTLQCVATKIRHNIHIIETYKSNTKVEDIISENLCDEVTL